MEGMRQMEDPLATNASDRMMTGVMCSMAILHAMYAVSKQSDGVKALSTGIGLSPLRPNSACNKSVCSVFVGRPVEGPPRCTSMMTSGSSAIIAKFMASLFRQMPGPDVDVTARLPAYEAPMAMQHPDISSSHWTVLTPSDLCFANS